MSLNPNTIKKKKNSSETTWPVFTKFHVDLSVEMGLRVCSNDIAPLTVISIYGKKIMIKKNTFFFFKAKDCWNGDTFISCNDRIGKMLHNICICSSYFTQLSKSWPVGLLFSFRVDPFSEGKQNNFDSSAPLPPSHLHRTPSPLPPSHTPESPPILLNKWTVGTKLFWQLYLYVFRT